MWAPTANLRANQSEDLAELLARVHLSRPAAGRYRRALFQATSLGGKYPTVDPLVDVLDPEGEPIGFFFAQVKATQSASRGGERLSLAVDMERYRSPTRLRAPAYRHRGRRWRRAELRRGSDAAGARDPAKHPA